MHDQPDDAVKQEQADEIAAVLRDDFAPPPTPPGATADCYRIAGYVDGLVGAARPDCDLLLPHFDSGLRFCDPNNPKPDDALWGGGVRGGVTWDGTFYRDLNRFAGGGPLFWCAYLKPGSAAGIKNGFWLNFGSGWAHLANDDPAQMLAGASPRLYFDSAVQQWKLVIEATMFVTGAVVNVWSGSKSGGADPVGTYARVSGCDPAATLSVAV